MFEPSDDDECYVRGQSLEASDDDELAARLAERRAEDRETLHARKREAAARGKEPFDLDRFEAIYVGSPARSGTREQRLTEYERAYYVTFGRLDTLGELAAHLEQLDHGSAPSDDPELAVRLAARANELAAEADAEHQREAIERWRELLRLVPEGQDDVPASELRGIFGRRWRELAPHRFRRADIGRAIDRAEQRARDLELARDVRAALSGEPSAWAERDDREARDGLSRALRASPEPARTKLAEAIAAHLGDPDVTRRTGAVAVAAELARVLGAERLAAIHRAHAALLRGVAPVGHTIDRPDLAWELLVGVGAALSPDDRDAIALLREHAPAEHGKWLLPSLAEHDGDWLVEHAGPIVPASSTLGLLRRLGGAPRRLALVDAIRWSPDAARRALASSAWRTLPLEREELDALRARIARAGGLEDAGG